MTKTPEELTENWKAGKLDVGFYYVKGVDGLFGVMSDYALYRVNLSNSESEIILLAPVPTYNEYKAMQLRIENEKRLLDYNGKLLNRLKETEETVKSLFQQIANANKTIEESTENVDDLKKDLAIQNEDIGKLRGLLRECKASVKLNSDITRGLEGKNSSNYQNLLSILSRINAALGGSEVK